MIRYYHFLLLSEWLCCRAQVITAPCDKQESTHPVRLTLLSCTQLATPLYLIGATEKAQNRLSRS